MKKIKIKPYVDVYLNEEIRKVYISRSFKDGNHFNVFELTDVGMFLFKRLNEPIYEEFLLNKVKEEFPNGIEEAKEILNYMKEEVYLDYYEESLEETIHPQHERILPIWAEFETEDKNRFDIYDALQGKTVGIIGCGTIGTGVAIKLALSGVRKFILMDDDKVELTNLSRQPMFSHSLIGQKKAEACKMMIEDRQPNPSVIVHNRRLSSVEDLDVFKECDLIVLCADEPSHDFLSTLVEEFSYKLNIPVSFAGGYNGNNAKINPFVVPGETYCFSCLKSSVETYSDKLGVQIGGHFTPSGTVQLSEIISSMVSFEILKFLTNTGQDYFKNKLRIFRMKDYGMNEIDCIPQPNCKRCSAVI